MTGKTHLMGGVAACLAVTQITTYDPLLMTASGAAGALLPDICHSGSKIGRKLPLVSRVIGTIFGHRSLTHSLLFLVIIGFLLDYFIANEALQAGVLIGMASHYLLDAATKRGIKLFYPLSITIKLPPAARTGGSFEAVVFTGLTFVTLYFGLDLL